MVKYYIPKDEFKIVGLEEIKPYIENAGQTTKALIALAWLTGARISELLLLKRGDFSIDEEKRELRIAIPTLKRKDLRKRELIFDIDKDPFIKDIIIPRVLKFKKDKSVIFHRSRRLYDMRLRKLNELLWGNDTKKWLTFHYLRHSRITWLARKRRLNVWEIQSFTGHKRSSSLDAYVIPEATKRAKGHFAEL